MHVIACVLERGHGNRGSRSHDRAPTFVTHMYPQVGLAFPIIVRPAHLDPMRRFVVNASRRHSFGEVSSNRIS